MGVISMLIRVLALLMILNVIKKSIQNVVFSKVKKLGKQSQSYNFL